MKKLILDVLLKWTQHYLHLYFQRDSSLECVRYFRFCRAKHLYMDFRGANFANHQDRLDLAFTLFDQNKRIITTQWPQMQDYFDTLYRCLVYRNGIFRYIFFQKPYNLASCIKDSFLYVSGTGKICFQILVR